MARGAKGLNPAQREKRKKLQTLKRKGLYSGDLSKSNEYQDRVIRKYADVLASEAKVLKVGTKAARELRSQGAKVNRSRVVVTAAPDEKISYSKRAKGIVARRTSESGDVVRTLVYQHTFDASKLPRPPKGVTYQYSAAFKQPKRGGVTMVPWRSSVEELEEYFNAPQYAKPTPEAQKAFHDLWTHNVSIRYVERAKR